MDYFIYLSTFAYYFFQLVLATIIYLMQDHSMKDFHVMKLKSINQQALVIISSIVFGLFHMGIYYTSEIILFQVIAVLGSMGSGFIFSRFRIKYGIFNAIKLHASVNAMAFIAIII
ncbi:hypothetical protein GCM10028791_23220 [Echinicola sediminis]